MKIPGDFGILLNLPVGVCAVDANLNIRFWNRRMELWTGLLMDDVSGRLLTELFPHLADDLFLERLNDSIYRHIPQYFSSGLGLSIIPEDNTSGKPMEQRTSIVPYQREGGSDEYALLIIEDISDLKKEVEAYRKMKDRAIMALNEQLRAEEEVFEANREANLYLEVMSHDLNNYNNVVLGYASLLEHSDEPKVQKYAKGIVLSAERSFQIIQSVSAVRKIKATSSAPFVVQLDNAVDEGIKRYSHIDISYTMTGAKVKAGNLLQEVFANLFGNSIRAGGMEVKIAVIVEDEGDHYLIHVDDDGPGLSAEEKNSIMYCSGEKDGNEYKLRSTGLQLYIVNKLLERYGTRLTIGESSLKGESEGTRFSFSLKKG